MKRYVKIPESKNSWKLYVCGYTDRSAGHYRGIHTFELDADSRTLQAVSGYGGIENPSFGMIEGARMYASSEVPTRGVLATFCIAENGGIQFEAMRGYDDAAGTCHVAVHPDKIALYGADYESGSICSCALAQDGKLGEAWPLVDHALSGLDRREDDPHKDRQLASHVHTLSFVPGTKLLAAVDLGGDCIAVYRTDSDGHIVDADGPRIPGFSVRPEYVVKTPEGSGPRIVAYHPILPMVAVVCELSCEVLIYRIFDGETEWQLEDRLSLLKTYERNGINADGSKLEEAPLAAHAEFSEDGRFLYVSTRGTNRITIFELDDSCNIVGHTDASCGGRTPRHFALSPDDEYLAVANQLSDCVVVFSRNSTTGALSEVSRGSCYAPSCIIWA